MGSKRASAGVTRDVVAAVFAHPDDAELACGGALAAFVASGAEVWLVSVCAGDKGSGHLVDGDSLSQQRAAESAAAAAVLGAAGRRGLGHPDGEVVNDRTLRGELVAFLREVRPRVVLTGDPTAAFFGSSYVNHRDHREVGWAVLDAVAPAAANPNYFEGIGDPHPVSELWLANSPQPDHWVDIEPYLEVKAEALACHRSQLGVGGELALDETGDPAQLVLAMLTERAAAEARGRFVAAAESFRRLMLG